MIYWKKLGDLERALSLFLQKIKVFVKILFLMARLPRFNRSGMPYWLVSPSKTIFLLVKLELIQHESLWTSNETGPAFSMVVFGLKHSGIKRNFHTGFAPTQCGTWIGMVLLSWIITYKDNKYTIVTVPFWLYR